MLLGAVCSFFGSVSACAACCCAVLNLHSTLFVDIYTRVQTWGVFGPLAHRGVCLYVSF